ncbi:MAG: UDP-N-acetylmuramoyl-L-alanyl-D-glutamate--2,6-diaminopimelate ligase [Candidatus Electryonea clarkiae]|nr:UDP-N-acetylmuramoyl-L-alanyl-D-glutamate--2,6-diaminopimelate ligase [Candidatus Electryonea clarkiae]
MRLAELAKRIQDIKVIGNDDIEVKFPRCNSKKIQNGDLFCAITGQTFDGNKFINEAIENGAVSIMTSNRNIEAPVPLLLIDDVRTGMAHASHALYNDPTNRIELTGITGTNGKTTCVNLLYSVFKALEMNPGRIGTLGWELDGKTEALNHTTPEAPDLLELISSMVEEEATHVIMEVTSIAIAMKRVEGFKFNAGLFTNLTQDHLDFHGSMPVYFQAKKRFFEMLPSHGVAVANGDDSAGLQMLKGIRADKVTFGFDAKWNVWGNIQELTSNGIKLKVGGDFGELEINSPLIGHFNAENLLGVTALCLALDVDKQAIKSGLETAPQVRGRMERIPLDGAVTAIIDYAHTPDAIRNVLQTLKPITGNKLSIVFGAGGDRDRAKRPLMAEAACELADRVYITSDNPRSEDPGKIVEDILEGTQRKDVNVIVDRRSAIKTAIEEAETGDIVLVAGKGHENYQIIDNTKFHFDDREEVLKLRKVIE